MRALLEQRAQARPGATQNLFDFCFWSGFRKRRRALG